MKMMPEGWIKFYLKWIAFGFKTAAFIVLRSHLVAVSKCSWRQAETRRHTQNNWPRPWVVSACVIFWGYINYRLQIFLWHNFLISVLLGRKLFLPASRSPVNKTNKGRKKQKLKHCQRLASFQKNPLSQFYIRPCEGRSAKFMYTNASLSIIIVAKASLHRNLEWHLQQLQIEGKMSFNETLKSTGSSLRGKLGSLIESALRKLSANVRWSFYQDCYCVRKPYLAINRRKVFILFFYVDRYTKFYMGQERPT